MLCGPVFLDLFLDVNFILIGHAATVPSLIECLEDCRQFRFRRLGHWRNVESIAHFADPQRGSRANALALTHGLGQHHLALGGYSNGRRHTRKIILRPLPVKPVRGQSARVGRRLEVPRMLGAEQPL